MYKFTKEQMKVARRTNLYDYMLRNHYDSIVREGNSIRLRDNHSISIKQGYCGYLDFATDEKGNSVDFLVRHLGYNLPDAVLALCGEYDKTTQTPREVSLSEEQSRPIFPEPLNNSYRNLFAYLVKRGISRETIEVLLKQKLIYQEAEHNNIVFANKECDWGEIRGTYDIGDKKYHGMIANSRHDGYWLFGVENNPAVAYICESAIDAISLYELHRMNNEHTNNAYVSIGGVTKQDTVNRLNNMYNVVIAVDNDTAGEVCRERNNNCDSIIPINKDWNEDLVRAKNG